MRYMSDGFQEECGREGELRWPGCGSKLMPGTCFNGGGPTCRAPSLFCGVCDEQFADRLQARLKSGRSLKHNLSNSFPDSGTGRAARKPSTDAE